MDASRPKIDPLDIVFLRTALDAARKGQATLPQLAAAHQIAERAMLNGTVGELRHYINAMTVKPPVHVAAKSVLLGVLSGILTHFIFNRLDISQPRLARKSHS